MCSCRPGPVCVCVCVFTSVEGEVQSAPMWSDPALPCILGNPVTPSAELGIFSLTKGGSYSVCLPLADWGEV